MILGGAGSLEASPGKPIIDLPDFPEAYKSKAIAQREALDVYRGEAAKLDWSYLSPAAEIHPGKCFRTYRIGGDALLTASNGNSEITFENYAVVVVDELERPQDLGRRFSVAY
jgi:putative NADH-flavin reductase